MKLQERFHRALGTGTATGKAVDRETGSEWIELECTIRRVQKRSVNSGVGRCPAPCRVGSRGSGEAELLLRAGSPGAEQQREITRIDQPGTIEVRFEGTAPPGTEQEGKITGPYAAIVIDVVEAVFGGVRHARTDGKGDDEKKCRTDSILRHAKTPWFVKRHKHRALGLPGFREFMERKGRFRSELT